MSETLESRILQQALTNYLVANHGPESQQPIATERLQKIHVFSDARTILEEALKEYRPAFAQQSSCIEALASQPSCLDGKNALQYITGAINVAEIGDGKRIDISIDPDKFIAEMQAATRELAPKSASRTVQPTSLKPVALGPKPLLDSGEIHAVVKSALGAYLKANHGPESVHPLTAQDIESAHFYVEGEGSNIENLVAKMLPTFASEKSALDTLARTTSPTGKGSAMEFLQSNCNGGLRCPDGISVDAHAFVPFLQEAARGAVAEKTAAAHIS